MQIKVQIFAERIIKNVSLIQTQGAKFPHY